MGQLCFRIMTLSNHVIYFVSHEDKMAAPTAAKEHLYKILVIGEFGVGKRILLEIIQT